MGEDSTEYLRIWEISTLGVKTKIGINFGQRVRPLSNDDGLKYPNGEIRLFNSLVGALNYLDRRGFEVISQRSSSGGAGEYLLRQKKIL